MNAIPMPDYNECDTITPKWCEEIAKAAEIIYRNIADDAERIRQDRLRLALDNIVKFGQ